MNRKLSRNTNGAASLVEAQAYLCGSVPVQKALSKPMTQTALYRVRHRERSQGGPAMCRREEAGQRYSGGCRVGPEGRASLHR